MATVSQPPATEQISVENPATGAVVGQVPILSADEVRALAERFDPFQNLTAHYLLAGLLRST